MLNKFVKFVLAAIFAVFPLATANAQSVKGTVTLPNLPGQLAVNLLSDRVYVAVPNSGAEPYDYLTVIDGKSDAVIKNIKIPAGAYAVAVDSFRDLVYVGDTYEDSNGSTHNQVVVVNPRNEEVIKTIPISSTSGDGILGLAVNWQTGDLYVSNGSDLEVDVIRHFRVQERIATSGEPYGIALNPSKDLIYVARLDGNVSVIDGRTNKITATTSFGSSDIGIAVDISTGKVFTTNAVGYPAKGTVGILDQSDTLLDTLSVGNVPYGIDVDFGTHLALVANTQDNTVSVIDGNTDKVTATLPITSGYFVAVNPASGKAYVASASDSTITVIKEK